MPDAGEAESDGPEVGRLNWIVEDGAAVGIASPAGGGLAAGAVRFGLLKTT